MLFNIMTVIEYRRVMISIQHVLPISRQSRRAYVILCGFLVYAYRMSQEMSAKLWVIISLAYFE